MDIAGLTIGPLNTVADIIDLSESFAVPGELGSQRRWAYRGQPREYQSLVPSFQRLFSRHSFGAAEIIEQDLIAAFRDHYAKLPDRSHDMPSPAAIGLNYDLRCLSVMQHYEVPTRLLDWTSDFWTAIYFACASDPDSHAELWAYDRQIFDAQRIEHPELDSLVSPLPDPPGEPMFLTRRAEHLLIELDPQLTPRMRTQAAHHTVSADVFADHAPLIDELQQCLLPSDTEPFRFRRVVIESSCKGKALRFLADHKNITASTIFPDVVGLGRFLRWHLDSLRTMLM